MCSAAILGGEVKEVIDDDGAWSARFDDLESTEHPECSPAVRRDFDRIDRF